MLSTHELTKVSAVSSSIAQYTSIDNGIYLNTKYLTILINALCFNPIKILIKHLTLKNVVIYLRRLND